MSNVVIGFLVVGGVVHVLLIAIPLANTLQAQISWKSRTFWSLFLLCLPLVGVALFHFRFRSSLFQGKVYEISAAEERARSGTLSPDDRD